MQQIAAENDLHPVQVTQWKGQMLEAAAGVFARGRDQEEESAEAEREKERLERKVGQLVVEVDWLKKVQGVGDRPMRKTMVDPGGPLSVRRQCKLLGVNRNRLASSARGGLGEEGLEMARRIDELHLRFPEFGARRMSQWLLREGMEGATRGWVAQVMKAMGFPRHLKLRPGSRCAVGRRMTNKPTIGGISERIFGQRGG